MNRTYLMWTYLRLFFLHVYMHSFLSKHVYQSWGWKETSCSPRLFQFSSMVDRRKSQNYTALPNYFTDSLWNLFASSSKEKSQSALFRHGWQLGLRCPSESTYAVIHNILSMVRPEANTKSMSTYERYQKIGEVKKAWKKWSRWWRRRTTSMRSTWSNCLNFPGTYQQSTAMPHFKMNQLWKVVPWCAFFVLLVLNNIFLHAWYIYIYTYINIYIYIYIYSRYVLGEANRNAAVCPLALTCTCHTAVWPLWLLLYKQDV